MKTTTIWFAIALSACASLDPNVGPWRVDPVSPASDAAVDVDPGECSQVGEGEVCFARDIRPLLRRTRDEAMAMGTGRGCFPCHDRTAATHTGTALSGLDMSTLGELRQGGGSTGVRIIVPRKPDDSVMVRALRGQYGSNRMPKGGPWWEPDSEEMRLLTTWIAEGAKGLPEE
jgi:hypothetical protein